MVPELVPEIVPETVPAYNEERDDEQEIEGQAPARCAERLPVAAPAASRRSAGFDGGVAPALPGAATLRSAEHATAGGRLGPSLECDRAERQRARPHAGGAGREPGFWGAIRAGANESGVRDRPHRDLRCGERDRGRLPRLHRPSPCTL